MPSSEQGCPSFQEDRDLFKRFLDERNFVAAFQRVLAKKSQGGIDRVSVEDFARHQHQNLRRLRREIEEDRYTPEPVQAAVIPKFNREFRQLGLPTVRDKIVQTALLQVVEPLAERLFLDTSYGYRKNKGHSKAIGRVAHFLANGMHWVVHQDVDNFFDTLNHDRLLRLFADLVGQDERLIRLAALWCRSGIVAKSGKWRNVETGVRQGQVISPLLANLYLHELDLFVQKRGWGWVRYADDLLVLLRDEAQATEADIAIKSYLKQELHLQLNVNNQPVNSLEKGFSFLGVFFEGNRKTISEKKIEKMNNQISWILSPKNESSLEKIVSRLEISVSGWIRYYGFLDPVEQFAELGKNIERRFALLARQRVTAGAWPKKPPAGLRLPLLHAGGDVLAEGRKRLLGAWMQVEGQGSASNNAKKQADKKVDVRRRQYLRHQVAEGEVVVATPGHFVGLRGERVIVRRQQIVVAEVPLDRFTGLTLGGRGVSFSTDVLKLCAEKNISVHFIDGLGRIFAVASRPDCIRVDLLKKQIIHRDDQIGLHLARMFLWGKVKNQFSLLKSFAKYKQRRKNGLDMGLLHAKKELEKTADAIKSLKPVDPEEFRSILFGLEGAFAARYWSLIGMIVPEEYNFSGRVHQGARDLVNSLLNYGYGILYAHTLTAVTKAGLSAMTGFLHASQGKKPVLTFDLIEEFRAPVVDRVVMSMLNRREALGQEKNGELNKETRTRLAANVLARLGSEVVHRGKRDTLKNVLYGQALAIRDFLYGKGGYKPYIMRW